MALVCAFKFICIQSGVVNCHLELNGGLWTTRRIGIEVDDNLSDFEIGLVTHDQALKQISLRAGSEVVFSQMRFWSESSHDATG